MAATILGCLAVLSTALLMGTTLAHALEMPAKMHASAREWLTFQHTLYRSFATIGGPIELGAIGLSAAMAIAMRTNRPTFWLALTAVVLLGIAFFVVWLGFTNPVNARTASWTADTMPSDWHRWRSQWEYSHLVRFVLQLLAFCCLLVVLTRASRVTT